MFSFKQVCMTQAFSALGFGVALLVVPKVLLAVMGVAAEPSEKLLAQILGGMLFALGASLYAVHDATLSPAAKTRIAVGNAVCDGLCAVLFVTGTWCDAVGVAGWAFGALFALNVASWLVTLRDR